MSQPQRDRTTKIINKFGKDRLDRLLATGAKASIILIGSCKDMTGDAVQHTCSFCPNKIWLSPYSSKKTSELGLRVACFVCASANEEVRKDLETELKRGRLALIDALREEHVV